MLADPGMRGMQPHHDQYHMNAQLQQESSAKSMSGLLPATDVLVAKFPCFPVV
jgi:hypothetical protein